MTRNEAFEQLLAALPPDPEGDSAWQAAARVIVDTELKRAEPLPDIPLRLTLHFDLESEGLLRWLKRAIRVEGGGDASVALGSA